MFSYCLHLIRDSKEIRNFNLLQTHLLLKKLMYNYIPILIHPLKTILQEKHVINKCVLCIASFHQDVIVFAIT